MLRKNQSALQMKTENGWEFVFCYSGQTGAVVLTKNRNKALNADYDLAFFANKYGNNEFRAEKSNLSEATCQCHYALNFKPKTCLVCGLPRSLDAYKVNPGKPNNQEG